MPFTYTLNSLTFIDPELGFGRERRVLCMAFFCLFVGFGGLWVFFVFNSNAASGVILAE